MSFLEKLFGKPAPSVDVQMAHTRLGAANPPILLDVRQPEEYRSVHAAGARLIPLGELARRLGELPKDTEILCICQSGNRSQTAAQQLLAAGYQATNVRGGTIAWQMAGLPVKKGMAK